MWVGLLKLIVMQPQLLLMHVQNYAQLIREGVQLKFNRWKLRVFLYVLSVGFLALGAMACVVVLLLWGALPILNAEHEWILTALPATLLLVSVAFYGLAQRYKTGSIFEDFQEQLDLDKLALDSALHK